MKNRFTICGFFALTVLFAGVARAVKLETKITSFVYADVTNHLAELCGHVIPTANSPATNAIVTIEVDRHGSAKYSTLADDDGNFCSVVFTYDGIASTTAKSAK